MSCRKMLEDRGDELSDLKVIFQEMWSVAKSNIPHHSSCRHLIRVGQCRRVLDIFSSRMENTEPQPPFFQAD